MVVTITSTVPVPGGAVTVMLSIAFTVKLEASVEPNATLLVPMK